MKMIKKFIVLLGVIALAACGGGGGGSSSGGAGGAGGAGGGGGGGSANFAPAAVGETLGNTICGFMDRCLPDVKAAFFGPDCAENMAASFTLQSGAQVAASIAAGRIVFDEAAYSTCMERIGALECDGVDMAFLESLNDCGVAFVGQVADGDACVESEECASESSYCASSEGACGGTCSPRLAAGEACATEEACESERCNTDAGPGRCAAIVGEGEGCETFDENTPPTECEDGLNCDNGVCTAGDDVAVSFDAGNGEACDFQTGTLCARGHFCGFSATGMGVCKPQAEVGQACEFGLLSPCVVNSYCDGLDFEAMPPVFMGTCVALPAAGEPCLVGEMPEEASDDEGQPFQCEAGLVCDAGTCVAPQPIGGSCTGSVACLSANCGADGACIEAELCELSAEAPATNGAEMEMPEEG